jgi:hypothetical protein
MKSGNENKQHLFYNNISHDDPDEWLHWFPDEKG